MNKLAPISMAFLASVAACCDRRLVTGIGFTVEETEARSSGFVLDVYYDNGPRFDGILVGSPSRSQEFEHVTVVYGHQTIYEGGRQEGHVTVGEGRIMTYHAVLDGQPTTRDFSDLLRPIAGWGWEIVAPERRPYGTATACPETYDDLELLIYQLYRHPSGVSLDVFTRCLYGDDGRFVHRSHSIEIGPEALRPPPLDWYQAPIDQRPPWPARR